MGHLSREVKRQAGRALLSRIAPISGFAVVSENIEGNTGNLVEQHQYVDGRVRQNQINLQHLDDGWRIALGDEKLIRGFDAALKQAAASGN